MEHEYYYEIYLIIEVAFTLIDELLWLAGILFARKACNDYYLNKLSRMVILIKISIVFTTLDLIICIMRAFHEEEYYNGMWIGIFAVI